MKRWPSFSSSQIQQGQLYNLRPKLASTNAVNAPAMAEADALALVFYPV
jgi:hypothetical protein